MQGQRVRVHNKSPESQSCAYCHSHLNQNPCECPGCKVSLHPSCLIERYRQGETECPTLGCGQSLEGYREAPEIPDSLRMVRGTFEVEEQGQRGRMKEALTMAAASGGLVFVLWIIAMFSTTIFWMLSFDDIVQKFLKFSTDHIVLSSVGLVASLTGAASWSISSKDKATIASCGASGWTFGFIFGALLSPLVFALNNPLYWPAYAAGLGLTAAVMMAIAFIFTKNSKPWGRFGRSPSVAHLSRERQRNKVRALKDKMQGQSEPAAVANEILEAEPQPSPEANADKDQKAAPDGSLSGPLSGPVVAINPAPATLDSAPEIKIQATEGSSESEPQSKD